MVSASPHLVVGTAGHVDHGKTSLVKALTGVDTDRLPEEKRRGITLELGFTHLALDGGLTVGLVDVPGHERFVKSMAAGAAGLDLVLLVVAADEGVMPQTREHLDICQALGVQGGVVVVSKADLLPGLGAAHRQALDAQLAALVKGSVLERAPVVTVSATSGEGLATLREALTRALGGVTPRPADGPLFVPIDRVFTVKGHGTVVTGTLASGTLAVGQAVRLEPGGLESAVRGLQVHGVSVATASAGQRVALNLKGLEVQHVSRGMAVVAPGELGRVLRLDVELAPRPGVQLPPRARVVLCAGAAHVEAECVRLPSPPGLVGARLRLDAPVVLHAGQRFILRGSRGAAAGGATLAGGRVLELDPPRARPAPEVLDCLARGPLRQRVALAVERAREAGLLPEAVALATGALPGACRRACDEAVREGLVARLDDGRLLGAQLLARLVARAQALLRAASAPLPRETLAGQLGLRRPGDLAPVLEALERAGAATVSAAGVQPRALKAAAPAEGEAALVALLAAKGLAPPTTAELPVALRQPPAAVSALLRSLVAKGEVVRAGELHFARAAIEDLISRVAAHLARHGSLSPQDFKALTGLSRKYAIPLLEHLDAVKLTLRVGDVRRLRQAPKPPAG